MGKKKPGKDFRNTPFKDLKGVSVFQPAEPVGTPELERISESPATEEDFLTQMSRLGVKPLDGNGSTPGPEAGAETQPEPPSEPAKDRELFLEALGSLDARMTDEWPEPRIPTHPPRRMKQLKQGKLKIEASLDLHGLSRNEALERTNHFLDNAGFHQLRTLLIVTGKGSHSAAGPVLRNALEQYLQSPGHPAVLEWGRAPREHGGEGALVVFLCRSVSQ
jgi:DNA-nicking Smr family endonuclease